MYVEYVGLLNPRLSVPFRLEREPARSFILCSISMLATNSFTLSSQQIHFKIKRINSVPFFVIVQVMAKMLMVK